MAHKHRNKSLQKYNHKLQKSNAVSVKIYKKIPFMKIEDIKKKVNKEDKKEVEDDQMFQKIKTSKICKTNEKSAESEIKPKDIDQKANNKRELSKDIDQKVNNKRELSKDIEQKANNKRELLKDIEQKVNNKRDLCKLELKDDKQNKDKNKTNKKAIVSNLKENDRIHESKRVTFAQNIESVKHIEPIKNHKVLKSIVINKESEAVKNNRVAKQSSEQTIKFKNSAEHSNSSDKECSKKKYKQDSDKQERNKQERNKENVVENKASNKESRKKNRKERRKENIATVKKNITDDEFKLLKHGTKKDQVTVLALIIEKNPKNCKEEFLSLIQKCNEERNEFVVFVLKNIKNILYNFKFDESTFFIKKKIVLLFEIFLNNKFVKKKLVEIIYQILKRNILFIDFIYIFINKLGDKEVSSIVFDNLMNLYELNLNRKIILFGLEELYLKDYKTRKIIVNFINKIKDAEMEETDLYKIFYNNLKNKDFNDKSEFEKTLHNIIKGLLRSAQQVVIDTVESKEDALDKVKSKEDALDTVQSEEDVIDTVKSREEVTVPGKSKEDGIDTVKSKKAITDTKFVLDDENLILHLYKNWELNFDILKYLKNTKSKNFTAQLLRVIKNTKFFEMKNKDEFLEFIFEYLRNESKDEKVIVCIESLLSFVIHTNFIYILQVLIMIGEILRIKNFSYDVFYALNTLKMHYHPIIRVYASLICDRKEIEKINPHNYEEVERILIKNK